MNAEFLDALNILAAEKGIDKEILFEAIEDALVSGYKRNFGTSQNIKVDLNRESGNVKVFAEKEVVEEVFDGSLYWVYIKSLFFL